METITEQQVIDRIERKRPHSKSRQILHALQRGDKLSGRDIWQRFGVYRASSVINRLRSRGHNIDTRMENGPGGVQYARYQYIGS